MDRSPAHYRWRQPAPCIVRAGCARHSSLLDTSAGWKLTAAKGEPLRIAVAAGDSHMSVTPPTPAGRGSGRPRRTRTGRSRRSPKAGRRSGPLPGRTQPSGRGPADHLPGPSPNSRGAGSDRMEHEAHGRDSTTKVFRAGRAANSRSTSPTRHGTLTQQPVAL